MATTIKGWRTLIVDGARYRWMVEREPKYIVGREANHWDNHPRPAMRFIVESASGSLLFVELNRPYPLCPWVAAEITSVTSFKSLRPITPSEVANEIRLALQQGWNADVKTKPFFRSVKDTESVPLP